MMLKIKKRYLHEIIHECPHLSLQRMFTGWKARLTVMTQTAESRGDDVLLSLMNYSERMLRKDENRPESLYTLS